MSEKFSMKYVVIILLICPLWATAQRVSLKGYVKDSVTNEFLIGATIELAEAKVGVATNAYGFFSLSVEKGTYTARINYLGYKMYAKKITIDVNKEQDFFLSPTAISLEEVVVSSEKENINVTKNEMSVNQLDVKTIKQIPYVLGEADIIKAIQLLPGVTSVNEGAGGFNVRGGSADQNLVLLDEAVVYNSSHVFGFFSVFNADAIKGVKLYKGGIPANYGGRLSSVLDVHMNEGNSNKFTGKGGIGLIASRLTLEGPLGKKSDGSAPGSFLLSGRRSYADIFLPLSSDTSINRSKVYFYDLNMRTNYKLGSRDRLYLSGYFGRDYLELPASFGNSWGNATATLRWNHTFGNKLFANITGIYSNFDYQIKFFPANSFQWKSSLSDYSVKADFNYYLSNNNFSFGLGTTYHTFEPGTIMPLGSKSTIKNTNYKERKAFVSFFYVGNEQKLSERLTIHYGLRVSYFARLANDSLKIYKDDKPVVFDATINSYRSGVVSEKRFMQEDESFAQNVGWEPRFSATYVINDKSSIKTSYNRMFQYIHLLSSSTSPTPLDVYTPSSTFIKPQIADQVAIGYFNNLKNNTYELSFETYYKWLQNQFDFIDGASPLFNENPETILLKGQGKAYGFEIMAKKNTGKLTGWVSYTYSRIQRQISGTDGGSGINGGNYYPANFDKPNNLAITGSYQLNKRWSLSANFVYQTGRPITYPVSKYTYNGLVTPEYSDRNQYRVPDYHRLDISATLKCKQRKHWSAQWIFGIYNVYNQQNAASIYFREQLKGNSETGMGTGIAKAYQLTYFGIVPSITYDFKF